MSIKCIEYLCYLQGDRNIVFVYTLCSVSVHSSYLRALTIVIVAVVFLMFCCIVISFTASDLFSRFVTIDGASRHHVFASFICLSMHACVRAYVHSHPGRSIPDRLAFHF